MIERIQEPKLGLPPGVDPQGPLAPGARGVPGAEQAAGGAAPRFWQVLDEVSGIQNRASQATDALVRGEPIELHEVMIRQEEARVAFSLLLETRNKVVEAYQEIMRMSL